MTTNTNKKKEVIRMTLIMLSTMLPTLMSYYFASGQVQGAVLKASMLLSFSIFYYTSFRTINLRGRSLFVSIFFLMCLVSLLHLSPGMPYLTLICISALMIAGVLSKNLDLEVVSDAFSNIAIVCSLLLIWKLLTTSIDMATVLRRGYVWTEIFAWAGLSSIWPICLFSSFLMRNSKQLYIGLLIMALCVVVNSISLKRYIYVDVFVSLAIIAYVSKQQKNKKAIKYLLIAGLPFIAFGIYYMSSGLGENVGLVTDAIFERFSESSEDISSFDRFEETKDWMSKEATLFDLLFGTGFLSTHHAIPDEEMNFLHIGWMNLIFKGGILLFFAFLSRELRAFKVVSHPDLYSKETVFGAMICIFYLFDFFYANAMAFGPNLFFLFYGVVQVANNSIKKKNDSCQEPLSGVAQKA